MRFIGIHKTGNYGTVWVKGEDGLYRSVEDEYVSGSVRALTQEDLDQDLEGKFVAELTQETISKLQTELGRNPTTIELADYAVKERRGKLLTEMMRNDEELGLYDNGNLFIRKADENLNIESI